ncbi:MAG TPA: tetratricopeptide repeat protein [Verrucomicrobiae bacterium]|nr:tetratricopeptide repeat protein [Verrucomicrobiae bacterium]
MVVYLPTMWNGFIWDDDDHFTHNPAMTAPGGLLQIWSSPRVSRYYPLTLTSFWVERRLWGLNPLPYHAVNILVHGVNAALLFILLRRLRIPGAWAAAALWAVHPVCVESVAWVTELKNVQSGLFFFLALLCYLQADESRASSRSTEVLTMVCGAAAMLSKPSTVVLPVVILLIAWWRRRRLHWDDLRGVTPLLWFGLTMSALTVFEQRRMVVLGFREVVLNIPERALLGGKIVWFYLAKVFWPARLMFIYPQWNLEPRVGVNWLPLLATIAVGVILWKVRTRQWGRACVFGLGCFVLCLLPVSGLFDIYFFRYSYVADHFQYLACIGPVALVAAGATVVVPTARLRATGALAVLLVLATLSWRYCQVFRNDETLWRDTLAKNPNAWLPHNNLGIILAGQNKVADASAEFAAALRIRPNSPETHNNVGLIYAGQGKMAEAIAEYQEALQTDPQYVEAHYNLGHALATQGQSSDAIFQYREALRLRPGAPLVLSGLAWTLATAQDGAVRNGEEAVRLAEQLCAMTGYRRAHAVQVLAAAYAEAGRFLDAILAAQKALAMANASGQPALATRIEAQLKQYEEMRPYREEAVASPLPQ